MIFSKEAEKKVQFLKGAGVMFIVSAVFFASYSLVTSNLNTERSIENAAKEKSQEIVVYRAVKNVDQGHTILKSDVKQKSYPKEYAVKNGLTSNIIGKVARIDINKNTQLTASMITDQNDVVTTDLRNQDYSDITLSKNLKVGDYVDIREKKKDGNDFIVVSKKKVLSINSNTIVLDILENERKFKNNATVDAALTGGNLYTTIYADPENQPAAAVTYTLNENIDKMIQSNPSIVSDSSQKLTTNNNSISTVNNKPSYANSTSK